MTQTVAPQEMHREARPRSASSTALRLRAEDGYPLGAQLFEPAGAPRGAVVVHGATAVPQRWYEGYAAWLAAQGFRVLTYDYRGVGRSRPASLRRLRATMTDWARKDALAALRWLKARSPSLPVFSVGHSFGGQLLGLEDELGEVDGAILVGSQLGFWKRWPAEDWPRLLLFFYGIIPGATALAGYLPGQLGLRTDLPAGVAREWGRWCRHPDYLLGFHPEAAGRLARFDRPTLFFSFTDDEFGPARAVDALLRRLPRAPLRHRRVDPAEVGRAVGHFGFFRPDFEGTLWAESLAFLEDRVEQRPHGFTPGEGRRRPAFELRLEDVLADLPSAPALPMR